MATAYLDPNRLAHAKDSYATRRVPRAELATLVDGQRTPRPGDLVLARVESLGHHDGVERPTGRRATLFPGDEVVLAYGHRYAPDQFEAEVPDDLGSCNLVAAGGLAARVCSQHAATRPATELNPVGLLADDDGRPVNLADWALPPAPAARRQPPVVVVVGTSMNAGKTTTVTGLIRGFAAGGQRVGAAKVTGTAAGKDLWQMRDAGADPVLDFSDAGHASTYLVESAKVLEIVETLTGHLRAAAVDAIVLEVADGLYQRETAALLASPAFAASVDAVLFAAGDAMGAAAGVAWLRQRGLPVRAVSGVVSSSPLGAREAELATSLPVLTKAQLQAGAGVAMLGPVSLAA
jgi:hypothetical protein